MWLWVMMQYACHVQFYPGSRRQNFVKISNKIGIFAAYESNSVFVLWPYAELKPMGVRNDRLFLTSVCRSRTHNDTCRNNAGRWILEYGNKPFIYLRFGYTYQCMGSNFSVVVVPKLAMVVVVMICEFHSLPRKLFDGCLVPRWGPKLQLVSKLSLLFNTK